MESGETYEGQQGYGAPETPKSSGASSQLPPVYYNTADNPSSGTPSPAPYSQFQKLPVVNQGVPSPSPAQPYNDPYRYQRHVPSPGSGRMMHRPPGMYQGTPNWPNSNSPAPQHMPYMQADRRYMHPQYAGYDPSKPYGAPPGHPSQAPVNPQSGWPGQNFSPNRPSYPSAPGPQSRHPQADIAGPVVPAGLQALQANNNNAALMQHQHTPMLVPNPHYNQNRVQSQPGPGQMTPGAPKAPDMLLEGQDKTPQRPGPEMHPQDGSQTPHTPQTPGYYPTHSPHMPTSNLGPMHHQIGVASPSLSPYPASATTPGSVKSKARGNKSYQCPKCVKVFRRGDHLKRHLLSVHDHEHPYQCGECGKGFASVPTLLKHAKSLHVGSLTKGLMCLRCQMTFLSIQELEAHATSLHVQEDDLYMQNINTSSKQHQCNTCTKSFASAANLKRHMQLVHRTKDETKLFCRECGKGFSRTDNLRKHVDRVHFGNPNAMPDLEEHDNDLETLSQPHSSESESRGPSVDTDESSLSGPPSNTMQRYPPPPTQPPPNQTPTYPGATMNPSPANQTMTQGYPQQYVKPNPTLPQQQQPPVQAAPSVTQNPPPTAPETQTPAPQPATSALGQMPKNQITQAQTTAPVHVPSKESPKPKEEQPSKPATTTAQPTEERSAPTSEAHTAQTPEAKSAPALTVPTPLAPQQPVVKPENVVNHTQRIEPKTVSEALSMAMKALSDFDYDTPGYEMYPSTYPSEPPAPPPAQPMNHFLHQNYSYYSMMENGGLRGVNSPRPPDSGSGVTHYSHPNFQRQDGNFLMTMPPPPGPTSVGRHLPQPQMAGVQEAPQLSRLLQEGGGGVKSPTVINNNNNSNTVQEAYSRAMGPSTQTKKKGRSRGRKKKEKENSENGMDFGGSTGMGAWKGEGSPEGGTVSCQVCGATYEAIDQLMIHIEGVHLKKNPHECCLCNKKFAQAGNVKRHIRFVHLRERPFRCKDCSSTFDRLCYLQRHMRSHLRPDDSSQDFNHLKPCSCPECGKKCLTAHHLRGHMQRKHFAKNKQNYGQFLMKYRHLEALGAGPGAISNYNRSRKGGRRKRKSKMCDQDLDMDQFSISNTPDSQSSSSPIPFSSMQPSSLSSFPQQQQQHIGNLQPNMVPQTTASFMPHQASYAPYQAQMQLKMGHAQNQSDATFVGATLPQMNQTHTTVTFVQYQNQMSASSSPASVTVPQQNVTAAFTGGTSLGSLPQATIQSSNKPMRFRSGLGKRTVTGGRKSKQKLLPYRCSHCVHRSFASLPLLKSHLSLVHGTTLKRHVCLSCGKSFSSSTRLRMHVYNAHRNKNAKVAKKKKRAAKKSSLQEMETVMNVPPQISYPTYNSPLSSYPMYNTPPDPNRPPHMVPYLPTQQPLYGYRYNSAMVTGSSVSGGYSNPSHHLANPMPLVQT